MKKIACCLVLAGLAGACTSASSAVGDVDDPRFQAVLAYVQQDLAQHGVPGAAVAVVVNGQLRAGAGLGVERAGGKTAVRPTTLFRVASLSKMVLAATTMTFVERGQLTLADPVTDYVPLTLASGFDPTTIPLTTLLDHTSGVPDLQNLNCPAGAGQLAAYLNAHIQPLWAPPGAVWDYSNRGFSILGWVLESVGGQPFETSVQSRILQPAGMTGATYDVAAAMAVDHAVGSQAGQDYDFDVYDCAAQHPPAGIMASVLDYGSFAELLLADGGSVLQPSSVAAMEGTWADTDQAPFGAQSYGYGLQYFRGDNARMIYHTGSLPGYRTAFFLFPEPKFAVVIFYNSGDYEPSGAALQAARIYLGDHITDGPQGMSHPLTTYAGSYVDALELGTITVTTDGTSLFASNVTPHPGLMLRADVPLQPLDGDAFNATLTNGDLLAVTFYPSDSEPAHWLVTRHGVATRQFALRHQ